MSMILLVSASESFSARETGPLQRKSAAAEAPRSSEGMKPGTARQALIQRAG
jgi:hypothetical protein